MLNINNRINKTNLKHNYLKEQRIQIEQPLVNNVENNKTPTNAVKQGTNIINNRLLFNHNYIINPVNKKKLTINKPVENIYEDFKTIKQPRRSKQQKQSNKSRQSKQLTQQRLQTRTQIYNNFDTILPMYYPIPILYPIEEIENKTDEKIEKFTNNNNYYNYKLLIIIILILYILTKWNL